MQNQFNCYENKSFMGKKLLIHKNGLKFSLATNLHNNIYLLATMHFKLKPKTKHQNFIIKMRLTVI